MRASRLSSAATALALTALPACGGAPRAQIDSPAPELDDAHARCDVWGAAPSTPLTVERLGAELRLEVPARYRFLRDQPFVDVHAARPLEFDARASFEEVPLRLPTLLRVRGVEIESGVRATDVRPSARGLEVTLEGEPLVELRLTIGCNAVAVDETLSPVYRGHPARESPTHAIAGAGPIELRSGPYEDPFGAAMIEEGRLVRLLDRMGSRARIERELEHGHLDAWIDVDRLRPAPPGSDWEGFGGCASCGGARWSGHATFGPLAYDGPAVLRRGAPVRGADDVVWARATEDVEVHAAVRPDPDAPVILMEIEGLLGDGGGSYLPSGITVRREDLRFPPGALPAP